MIELDGPAENKFLWKIRPATGSDCWLWVDIPSKAGYGVFYCPGTRDHVVRHLAHRVSYTLWKGPIPEGLVIDHLCRVRRCVNPDHLEAVTQGENLRRGIGPQLSRERESAKTHCRNGHEYTEEDSYVCVKGWRRCRPCKRRTQKASRDKAKGLPCE